MTEKGRNRAEIVYEDNSSNCPLLVVIHSISVSADWFSATGKALSSEKKNVRYIGLKHKDVSFAISLTEHDSVQLLDDDSREKSGSETYYERKCDALFDIDGRGNTERLVARNPKLKNLLKDGEYIPSLGQLNLMAHYMDELNKAFAYVSASPLSSTWYRSSTESSPSVAWYVDFSIGSAYYSDKYNSSRVRAVIDF